MPQKKCRRKQSKGSFRKCCSLGIGVFAISIIRLVCQGFEYLIARSDYLEAQKRNPVDRRYTEALSGLACIVYIGEMIWQALLLIATCLENSCMLKLWVCGMVVTILFDATLFLYVLLSWLTVDKVLFRSIWLLISSFVLIADVASIIMVCLYCKILDALSNFVESPAENSAARTIRKKIKVNHKTYV